MNAAEREKVFFLCSSDHFDHTFWEPAPSETFSRDVSVRRQNQKCGVSVDVKA